MKRDYGEGSVFQRANGKWFASERWRDDSGRPRRTEISAKTKSEAKRKLRDFQLNLSQGQVPVDSRMTVQQWSETWIESTLRASSRRPSTKSTYETLIRRHIQPVLGHLTLRDLSVRHVERWLMDLQRSRSNSTARQVHNVLCMMLDTAVKHQMIRRNPAKVVPRPSPSRSEAVAFTVDEIRSLVDASTGDRLATFLTLLIYTGMRRGEALALRWSDVRLKGEVPFVHVGGTLSRIDGRLVRTEPKTEAGRRAVPLVEPVVKALASARALQARDKLRLGEAWSGSDWVFTTEEGKPVDPRNALRWFYGVRDRAGIGKGSLHSLRHSAASTLLEAGIPMPEIRDVLGHSSIAVTVDLYGHLSYQHLHGAISRGLLAYGQ